MPNYTDAKTKKKDRNKDEDKGLKQTIYSVNKKSSQLQIGLV
jgi:hypothetical protein